MTDVSKSSQISEITMDFGEININSEIKLHLYGSPGQERFRFMWDIMVRGGTGLIILVDNSRPSPLVDLDIYLDNFSDFINETGAAIGITQSELVNKNTLVLDDYYRHLEKRGMILPIFYIDARKRDDVIFLLDNLIAMLEFN